MHQFDDQSFVTALDPKGMLQLYTDFPTQCETALRIAKEVPLPFGGKPDNVILTGMGGSAAGGDFVKAIIDAHGKVPFSVNRDYSVPNWVGPASLVFATSYSGNTEETIAAYTQAKKAGASIIVVTSGGTLAEMAKADGFPCIIIPGGQPPRTALGYMLIPVVVACEKIGLIPEQDYEALMAHIKNCVATYGMENPYETNDAKKLAEALFGKLSVVYGLGGWQGLVASRWKGQINEDSKDMTFYHVFPELNHNEILGWVNCTNQGVNKWVIITIGDGNESAKIKARVKITLELIGDRAEQHHVVAKGNTVLEKMIWVAMMSDFVSCYLAALNKVDPEDISWLTYMKGELAKVN